MVDYQMVKNTLTLPVPIPGEEKNEVTFLFSHFFVVSQKVL